MRGILSVVFRTIAAATPDWAALSPLLTLHINPYGRFDLDMEKRLPLDA